MNAEKIKIAICDDESSYTDSLKALIKKHLPREMELELEEYHSGEMCLATIINDPVDILFMDIELGTTTGIEVVKEYSKSHPETITFFVTSYNNYYTDLFRIGNVLKMVLQLIA